MGNYLCFVCRMSDTLEPAVD